MSTQTPNASRPTWSGSDSSSVISYSFVYALPYKRRERTQTTATKLLMEKLPYFLYLTCKMWAFRFFRVPCHSEPRFFVKIPDLLSVRTLSQEMKGLRMWAIRYIARAYHATWRNSFWFRNLMYLANFCCLQTEPFVLLITVHHDHWKCF